jgi:ABC-type bacteriocin/lantibiotic exporter with double-glycine peptidase domain
MQQLLQPENLILKCKLNTLIQDNPDGLHTPIGVGGILLSGGEKQRIGIARALYSNPKLIVLDEPTSALDPKTELEILNLILEIDPRTTVILITHKLHQLVNFPRIIFLEHGRILCDGNFTTVKAKITSFANLLDIAGL